MLRTALLSLVLALLNGCSVDCNTTLGDLAWVHRNEDGFRDVVNVLAKPDVLCQSQDYAADTRWVRKRLALSPPRWDAFRSLLDEPELVAVYESDAVSPGSEQECFGEPRRCYDVGFTVANLESQPSYVIQIPPSTQPWTAETNALIDTFQVVWEDCMENGERFEFSCP
ncbi:MAG: hypothetical protein WAU39_05890 [Polyangiales bacterium]